MKSIDKKETNPAPLVSIVTVVRNAEDTLEKAISSVLNQSYQKIEYIVIDGGSRDGTLEIIKKYEDKIAYWVSEPDAGISDAFNKGIMRASGVLVGILNSDDWYEPDAIGKVVAAYLRDETIGVIHGDLLLYQGNAAPLLLRPHPDAHRIRFEMIYNHPACFVAWRLYEQFGYFDTKLKVAMDYELLLRFYTRGAKFYYLPEVLVNMRRQGNADKHRYACVKEFYDTMVKYGYPRHKAFLFYIYRMLTETVTVLLGDNRLMVLKLKQRVLYARREKQRTSS